MAIEMRSKGVRLAKVNISTNSWDVYKISEFLDLTIIASVDQTRLDTKDRLNMLLTIDFYGGMNKRNAKNRRKKN